jgi:hypothetical protein
VDDAIRVDRGAHVEARSSPVIAEPAACFLDKDRRRSVIPDVVAEPDTGVQCSFCDSVLMAPAPWLIHAGSTQEPFDDLLLLDCHAVEAGQRCDTVGLRGFRGRNVGTSS